MSSHAYTHIIAVGACYIDTILTVPAYPAEDAKQRASSLSRRRGGNCPNTLEVLQQLLPIQHYKTSIHEVHDETNYNLPSLILLSTLPSPDSPDSNFITESFNASAPPTNKISSTPSHSPDHAMPTKSPVNLNYTFHRSNPTAASSYIIQSESTSTRTIVNHNALSEMTFSEFRTAIIRLISSSSSSSSSSQPLQLWFHFEGRIPDTLLQCTRWLRETFASPFQSSASASVTYPDISATISVEVEKPARSGLRDLAAQADVVFYSRSWAEGQGYDSAEACLVGEAGWLLSVEGSYERVGRRGKLVLCCTWGAEGASTLEVAVSSTGAVDGSEGEVVEVDGKDVVSRPAWRREVEQGNVVDTIGAGDTWIAGMLYGWVRFPEWSVRRRVDFANELAGRKVLREGFVGLGEQMRDMVVDGSLGE